MDVLFLDLSKSDAPRGNGGRRLGKLAIEEGTPMSTVSSSPRRPRLMKSLAVVLVIGTCCMLTVRWPEVAAGLGLAVAVLAWFAPRRGS